jgi:hypothetical protein
MMCWPCNLGGEIIVLRYDLGGLLEHSEGGDMEEMENVIKPDVAERRCENGTQIKSADIHD